MEHLDELYARLLHFGLLLTRDALASNDCAWAYAQIEMLHNIPSLLGEKNPERHRYYWFTERDHYMKWAQESGSEIARSRMRVFYEPIWLEMEPILLETLAS